jgi:hypothetical protein
LEWLVKCHLPVRREEADTDNTQGVHERKKRDREKEYLFELGLSGLFAF